LKIGRAATRPLFVGTLPAKTGVASLDAVFKNSVDFFAGNDRQTLAKANHLELCLPYERVARAVADAEYPKRFDKLIAATAHAFFYA
jgi:hypothetical protein